MTTEITLINPAGFAALQPTLAGSAEQCRSATEVC
ncbi:hypothetical protein Rruber_05626 (plasmid) [Rhodococcus ruber]